MGHIRLPSSSPGQVEEPNKGLSDLLDPGIIPILRNAQMILSHDPHFYCLIPGAYILASLIPESGPIPIGVLIRLWERWKWMAPCRNCNEWVYIIGAAGNPLSGTHSWWGICSGCRGDINQQGPAFIRGEARSFIQDLCVPVCDLLRIYDNRPVVPKLDNQPWSWTATPIYVPPPEPVRPVEPTPFLDLLQVIHNIENNQQHQRS